MQLKCETQKFLTFATEKNPEPGSRPEGAMVVSLTDLGYLGRRAKNNGNEAHLLSLLPFYSRGVPKWLMTEGEQLGHTKKFRTISHQAPRLGGGGGPSCSPIEGSHFP